MDAAQINQLCQSDRFNHPVHSIRLIETHISWVILTGDYVYKIKKPVNFGFLDFSTLEKRKFCCHEELRLNGRASAGLYLVVVPVTCADGKLMMGGTGDIIEYAVQMRQFDPQATLLELLTTGQMMLEQFDRLGYSIGAFHAQAAVAEPDSGWGNHAAVAFPVQENFHQILPLAPDAERAQVETLQQRAMESLADLSSCFTRRKAAGCVRELHGDLHAGNIALIDQQWVPFDCIEFNPNLRWIDTASDVAFLLMDLECRGFRAEANRFLNAYLEYTGDYDLLQVLRFYQRYRAMVRAKVALLRLQQACAAQERLTLQNEFNHYLTYCETMQAHRRPFLVMMMGVSGSGKSTTARQVAAHYGAIHVRSDAVRKRLFGLMPDQVSATELRNDLYSEAASRRTFSRMEALVKSLLKWSYQVIVDATFIRRSTRTPFLALARQCKVPVVILSCGADEAELENRILQRMRVGNDVSEADVQVMRNQLRHLDALDETESPFSIAVGEAGWESRLAGLIS